MRAAPILALHASGDASKAEKMNPTKTYSQSRGLIWHHDVFAKLVTMIAERADGVFGSA